MTLRAWLETVPREFGAHMDRELVSVGMYDDGRVVFGFAPDDGTSAAPAVPPQNKPPLIGSAKEATP